MPYAIDPALTAPRPPIVHRIFDQRLPLDDQPYVPRKTVDTGKRLQQEAAVRADIAAGMTQTAISEKYGMGRKTVRRIARL